MAANTTWKHSSSTDTAAHFTTSGTNRPTSDRFVLREGGTGGLGEGR